MRRLAVAVIAALLTTAAPAQEPAPGPEAASPEALAFVSQFSDDHLSGMLSRIGGQSTVMSELSKIDGRVLAAALDAEIDAAVERHGDEWAHNMALAWSPLLGDVEMASLVEDGANSPYADRYLAQRDEAAAGMATLSQDLFREILAEVMRNTLKRLSGEAQTD